MSNKVRTDQFSKGGKDSVRLCGVDSPGLQRCAGV